MTNAHLDDLEHDSQEESGGAVGKEIDPGPEPTDRQLDRIDARERMVERMAGITRPEDQTREMVLAARYKVISDKDRVSQGEQPWLYVDNPEIWKLL